MSFPACITFHVEVGSPDHMETGPALDKKNRKYSKNNMHLGREGGDMGLFSVSSANLRVTVKGA